MNLKNRRTLWCSIILAIFFISAINPIFGLATDYKYVTTTVSTSESQNSAMAVILPKASMYSTIQVQSDAPGNFNVTDYLDNPYGPNATVPDTTDANLYYPMNIGNSINYGSQYGIVNESQARYVNVQNNSVSTFGNYSISLVTEKHEIQPGDSINFFFTTSLNEIDVKAEKAGIYKIWYNNITMNSLDIVSPSGKSIEPVLDQLPPVSYGSTISMGKYFYFLATETGYYQIYFKASGTFIQARCEFQGAKSIKFGQSISAGVDPGSSEFMNPTYSMDVYSFKVDVADYYSYFLNFDYGFPETYFYITTPYTTFPSSFTPSPNGIFEPVASGTVYIIIDNPSYFSWSYPGITNPAPIKYAIKFSEIVPKTYQPDNGSELIAVTQTNIGEAKTMDISQTSVLSMQCTNYGSSSPTIVGSSPYWQEIVDGQAQYPQVWKSVYSNVTEQDLNILMSPGTYKIIFQHQSTNLIDYMMLNTTLTPVSTANVTLKNVTVPLNGSDFTDFTLQNWGNVSSVGAAGLGNAITFGIDSNFRNYGYNITLDQSKNPSVFNKNIDPTLGFLYGASSPRTFTNYSALILPTNGYVVPFKTNGSTNGDSFIIGSFDKFKGITLDISQSPDTDAFVWQYLSSSGGSGTGYGSSWRTFSPTANNFTDNTNVNGSMRKDGAISWDPDTLTNWNYIHRTSNYTSNTLPLPDTQGRNLYLIRVWCNNSASTIPNITSVTINKYIKVNIGLQIELGFDVHLFNTQFFDHTTGVIDWSGGQTVTNTGNPVSINDSNFGLNMNFNYKTGFIFFSGLNWFVINYNGSDSGVSQRLNQSLIFSASVYRNDNYRQFEYNISENIPSNRTGQFNINNFTKYDAIYSYNASAYHLAYIKIIPRTKYDWTQVNVEISNGTLNGVKLISAHHQLNYQLATDSSYEANLGIIDANFSIEFGFTADYVLLELNISSINPDALTGIHVYSGQFNYPSLTYTIKSPFIWQLWMTITTIAGGAAIAIVVVSLVIHKKRNPI